MSHLTQGKRINKQLEDYARSQLKDGLAQLPEAHQHKFKLMYGRDNGKRSVEDAIALPIEDLVGMMSADKLDWAMQQVDNSLKKIQKEKI